MTPFTNLTDKLNVHCTSDMNWKNPYTIDTKKYLYGCKQAARMARKDLWFDGHFELDEDYEILAHAARARTTRPQISLPKIYAASKSSLILLFPITKRKHCVTASPLSLFPSCTIAIAMIGSLNLGPPLPGERPAAGEFWSSDTMTLRDILSSASEPYIQCVRRGTDAPDQWDPALGWAQAGRWFLHELVWSGYSLTLLEKAIMAMLVCFRWGLIRLWIDGFRDLDRLLRE